MGKTGNGSGSDTATQGNDAHNNDNTNGQSTDKDNGNDGQQQKQTISVEEFDSLKKSHQEAQKLIKQYQAQDKEKEKETEQKKQDDMKKKGEFEKLEQNWRTKETELQTQLTTLQDNVKTKDEALLSLATKQLEDAKTQLTEEQYKEMQTLFDTTNALVVLQKLPSFLKLLGTNNNSGGTKLPKGGVHDDIKHLQERIIKGETLSHKEMQKIRSTNTTG